MILQDVAGFVLALMLTAVCSLLFGIEIGRCSENELWNRSLESAGLQVVWHEERTSSGCTNWIEIAKKEVRND